jgi:hypothetical protein
MPDAAVLQRLRLDLSPTPRETAARDARDVPTGERVAPTTAIPVESPAGHGRPVRAVRTWLVSIGALIAVGTLVSIFLVRGSPDPLGPTARPVATDVGSPIPRTGIPAAAPTAETPPARDPALSLPAPPKADVATSVRASQDAEGTTAPAVSRSAPAVPSNTTNPRVDAKRTVTDTPAAATPANAAAGQGSARCRHIIEKTELGEPLSEDEKRELASSCR